MKSVFFYFAESNIQQRKSRQTNMHSDADHSVQERSICGSVIIEHKRADELIRIGFTGSRHVLNEEQKREIVSFLDNYENMIVSHGDCVGADAEFHALCVQYRKMHPEKQLAIHIFPPNVSTMRAYCTADVLMPEKPYLERNADIVRNSDVLLACPVDKNKEEWRSGTWSTVRKARKMGIPVHLL